jgi:hypothetical protein
MTFDVFSSPDPQPLPRHRFVLRRAHLLNAIAEGEAHGSSRWRWPDATMPRRLVLAVAVVASLGVVGGAVATGIDFLREQDRVDQRPWQPPQYLPVSDRAEIVRGRDWSFMAWGGSASVCVAYAAGSVTNWARACGPNPSRTERDHDSSDHLITLLMVASTERGASDGRGAIVGAVTPDVARFEVELVDGRVLSASTRPAPAALNVDARVFVMRAPLELRAPAYRAVKLYGHSGMLLERVAHR